MARKTVDITIKAHNQASQTMKQVGRDAKGMGKSFGDVKRSLMALGGGYLGVQFLRAGMTDARAFEKSMAGVATMLSGPALASLGEYRKGIEALSLEYGQSVDTLSKGLYDILSAGVAPAKAMGVLRVAAEAAIGGLTDTATAVDGLTTVLNAYRLSADEATFVSDVMFSIVKEGKITFAELARGIGGLAPMAKAAGVGLSEMAAMLATIVKIEKPERAITALRSALIYAAKSGLPLLDLVNQFRGKSLADIVGAGINDEAARGIVLLSGSYDALARSLKDFQNVAGEAKTAFDKLNKTADASLSRAEQRLKKFQRDVGTIATETAGFWIAVLQNMWEEGSWNVQKAASRLEMEPGLEEAARAKVEYAATMKALDEATIDETSDETRLTSYREIIKLLDKVVKLRGLAFGSEGLHGFAKTRREEKKRYQEMAAPLVGKEAEAAEAAAKKKLFDAAKPEFDRVQKEMADSTLSAADKEISALQLKAEKYREVYRKRGEDVSEINKWELREYEKIQGKKKKADEAAAPGQRDRGPQGMVEALLLTRVPGAVANGPAAKAAEATARNTAAVAERSTLTIEQLIELNRQIREGRQPLFAF